MDILQESFPYIWQAFLVTLWMSAIVIVIATVIGLLVSVINVAKIPLVTQILSVYGNLFRNTPLLIQLFFIYFGLGNLGLRIPSSVAAIIGASLLGGAYMAGAFRGGFNGVDSVQIQSGRALGMSKLQRIRFITIPQGLTRAVPGIAANAIFLIKETSVFTVIAVPELTNQIRVLNTINYETTQDFMALVLGYAIILIPLSILLTYLERRVRRATFAS